MTMANLLRCSPKRFIKFIIVCLSIIGLVVYFPRNPVKEEVYRAQPLHYVDPDRQLRRDPGLVHFTAKPDSVTTRPDSIKLNIYTKSRMIRFNHTCKPRLKVGSQNTPICVYGRNLDSMVSSYVSDHGTWEREQLDIMSKILDQNPDMQVIDLGCNIGVYTLFAAKKGRRVYAVDPLESNLQLLQQSLTLGNLRDKVTLVHHAISDNHKIMTIDLRLGNIGGSQVDAISKPDDPIDRPHKRVKRYKRLHKVPLRKHKLVKKSITNSPLLKQKKDVALQHKVPAHRQNKVPVKPEKSKPVENNLRILKPIKPKDIDIAKVLPIMRKEQKITTKKPSVVKNQKKAKKSHNASNVKHKSVKINAPSKYGEGDKVKSGKRKGVRAQNKSSFDDSIVLNQDKNVVQAVTLDDLVKLGLFKPTFLKMDIEGGEYLALRKASTFLRDFDVRFIMMEWTNLRGRKEGQKVMYYLVKNGFLPYKNNRKNEFLETQSSHKWPDNVLWKKR